MKAVLSVFKRRRELEREVEEELGFHLELLRREHVRQGMSPDEANAAARTRFGDMEQIKKQCVAISRRSRPLTRALKFFFILMFLAGVLVRVFAVELHFTRVGDMLIMVSVLGQLLLYARSLSPATFLSKQTQSPLRLIHDKAPTAAFDERQRTPVERVISEE